MLQAEEACGGGGGSATVEGCTMASRVGGERVPSSTVLANSTGMTTFSADTERHEEGSAVSWAILPDRAHPHGQPAD